MVVDWTELHIQGYVERALEAFLLESRFSLNSCAFQPRIVFSDIRLPCILLYQAISSEHKFGKIGGWLQASALDE